jgi:hypothetical protein
VFFLRKTSDPFHFFNDYYAVWLFAKHHGWWQAISRLRPPQRSLATRKAHTTLNRISVAYAPIAHWVGLSFTFVSDILGLRGQARSHGVASGEKGFKDSAELIPTVDPRLYFFKS